MHDLDFAKIRCISLFTYYKQGSLKIFLNIPIFFFRELLNFWSLFSILTWSLIPFLKSSIDCLNFSSGWFPFWNQSSLFENNLSEKHVRIVFLFLTPRGTWITTALAIFISIKKNYTFKLRENILYLYQISFIKTKI